MAFVTQEERDKRNARITAMLEENIELRNRAEERFELAFEKELNRLRNMLQEERQVREHEDDEIVDALKRYTSKLQSSLKIINSIDT